MKFQNTKDKKSSCYTLYLAYGMRKLNVKVNREYIELYILIYYI